MGEAIAKIFSSIAQYALVSIVIIFAVAIIALVLIIAVIKKRKKRKLQKVSQVQETAEGRYSLPDDLAPLQPDGDANASFIKQDRVISRGQTVVAGKNNDIPIGRYTILTTIDGINSFNVRINGFVREVEHNSVIILGEGDSICPVSHSIILR